MDSRRATEINFSSGGVGFETHRSGQPLSRKGPAFHGRSHDGWFGQLDAASNSGVQGPRGSVCDMPVEEPWSIKVKAVGRCHKGSETNIQCHKDEKLISVPGGTGFGYAKWGCGPACMARIKNAEGPPLQATPNLSKT